MAKIGDMELPRQKKEHEQFVEMIDSYNISDMTDEQSIQAVNELLSYMAKWLYRHILGSDTMIGRLTDTEKKEDAFAFVDMYRTGITFIDNEHERLF